MIFLFSDHFHGMLSISKRMTEYELGSAFNLPDITGRQAITDFYTVLENILLRYDRSTSVFSAKESLLDTLFPYSKFRLLVS